MDNISLLIEPSLKFLDLQTCHLIFQCLRDAETTSEKGVFQTDVWKLYRQRHLPETISPFESFKFDEQFTNMYRAGLEGMYAREDYNKFSTVKHDGYSTYAENVVKKHPGYEVNRNNGLFYVPNTGLESIQDLKTRLLSPPN